MSAASWSRALCAKYRDPGTGSPSVSTLARRQALQLQLAEERQRYGKLQQAATASWIHCASNITFYSSNWTHHPQAGKPD